MRGWTAAMVAAGALTGLTAPACAAGDGQPWLQGQVGDVSLTTTAEAPDGRARMGGALSYTATPADGLTTRLDVNLKAGEAADGLLWPGASVDANRPWSDLGLGLHAAWAAVPQAKLEVNLTDRLFTRPITPSALGGEADAPRDERNEQGAGVSASLQPASQLRLTVDGQVRSASDTMDLPADRALLRTRDGQVGAALAWTPAPRLKLEAGGRLTTTAVAWTEGAAAAQDFAAVQPTATLTLTPWSQGAFAVGVERAVTPLDAAKFVTLARVSAAAAPTGLQPDQEWRVHARWTQALPRAGRIELGYTEAELQSSTELTRVAGAEAPGSVEGGRRSQYDLAVSLPLSTVGLRSMALDTHAVWRRSAITDPVTGAERRLSGEAAYETSVALTQTLGKSGVVWGLNTRDLGAQSFYGVSQVSSVQTDPSLGAFVEFRPAPYAVRLQLDDIAGGERRWTDSFYADGRETGDLQRTDHRTEGGPGFTLSLRKAL